MARLKSMLNLEQIKSLRGSIDFYYWRGVPIARKWPRPSNLIPTPKQKVNRERFAAVQLWMRNLSPFERAAYQAHQPPTEQTWADLIRSCQMRNLAEGCMLDPLPSLALGKKWVGFLPWWWIRVEWSSRTYVPPSSLRALVVNLPEGQTYTGWWIHHLKRQRGRNQFPVYRPSLGDCWIRAMTRAPTVRNLWQCRVPHTWPNPVLYWVHVDQSDYNNVQSGCHLLPEDDHLWE